MNLLRPRTAAGLKRTLLLLLVALLAPTVVLLWQAWRQTGLESMLQQQGLAREFVAGVNRSLAALEAQEAGRSTDDYLFALPTDGRATNIIQRSPLAVVPVPAAPRGLRGHFQIAPDGAFSTPLLPEDPDTLAALDVADVATRADLAVSLREAVQGQPVAAAPATPPARQRAAGALVAAEMASSDAPEQDVFSDALEENVQGSSPVAVLQAPAELGANREAYARLELAQKPASATPLAKERRDDEAPGRSQLAEAETVDESRLRSLDSEAEALAFLLVDGAHFLLFRRVYRDGDRLIQGAVLATDEFLDGQVLAPFRGAGVSRHAALAVRWGDRTLAKERRGGGSRYLASKPELGGQVFHVERLAAPFDGLQLEFTVVDLPPGPAAGVVFWSGALLLLLLPLSFWVVYRAGARTLELVGQQQAFVSAVSHELRTPLTSIRMYSEMLQAGWVDEARRQQYYTFINDESERLSRLVADVLQLSRMSRTGLDLALEPVPVTALLAGVREPLEAMVRPAGFELVVSADAEGAMVRIDRDAFLQVLINLVDNALKFAAGSDRREIEVAAVRDPAGVRFTVRDFGPGLPDGKPDRLFELFYRAREDGSVRGTGIGLALVRGLVEAMGGSITARRCDPGAAFDIRLPPVTNEDST
ncbi:MAG: HAMP domain-containing sensor histidine kinase [Pseudomonadota bacterium]